MIEKIVIILISYLMGSIPFGLLVGKIVKGIDIREHGSGNIGTANVSRVIGKRWGAVVFILDSIKGLLPTLFSKIRYPQDSTLMLITGIAAILGHTYSLFLNFKGGKGVATAFGVMLVLLPIPTLITLGIFTIVFIMTGFVSLSSIIAAISLPILALIFNLKFLITAMVSILSCLVIYNHRENIKRIVNKEENKFFNGLVYQILLPRRTAKK
jgi:glycerol-3-phosphate acyltransferase PlsY